MEKEKKKKMKAQAMFLLKKIAINLFVLLVVLAVVSLVYAVGKLEFAWAHDCPAWGFYQAVYESCMSAMMCVMLGFVVAFWVLDAMMKWRKKKLLKATYRYLEETDDHPAFMAFVKPMPNMSYGMMSFNRKDKDKDDKKEEITDGKE